MNSRVSDTRLSSSCEPINMAEKARESDDLLIDRQQLGSLVNDVGSETAVEIANFFESEARVALGDVLEAFENSDLDEIARHAHAAKSGAASLGCASLARQYELIEAVIRSADHRSLGSVVQPLEDILERSLASLLQQIEAH